ncbi:PENTATRICOPEPTIDE REPEAT-CONTAINING PROTEIN [Salix koriyanagi]|uniref:PENTATRICOPEPTIDE REPEAT-CONTAINING PROTEIN n=1 Tax=Salix koriyanagi TaxID=2511006 RepID=A0A9Q0P6S4_9ROSI|nr:PENTATRICOPEPTIDE REPEAT-CONTAINING PROTEIN [Salix koriyanagi]
MRYDNTPPNHFTIPMIVATCAELLWLEKGKYIHGLVSKSGLFAENSAVGSSFVYMYAKCGDMEDASLMFDEIVVRDVVSWTALVIGYVHNDDSEKSLECLCEMHRIGGDGEKVNPRTLEVVQSSLLSMYSKCGNVEEARNSFCQVVDKDVFAWTSVMGVCARFGFMNECLNQFWDMQVDDVYPDGIVVSCILLGFGNSMMFGTPSPAGKLFDGVHEWSKESWNTMVFGYCKMGIEGKCLELFREMRDLGIEADSNSLVSVISSCSQLGLINLCRSVHCYIIKNSVNEDVSIANSLIDMYGKGENDGYYIMLSNMYGSMGKWDEAERTRELMKERGVAKRAGWSAV